jgi:hypothetical protein
MVSEFLDENNSFVLKAEVTRVDERIIGEKQ